MFKGYALDLGGEQFCSKVYDPFSIAALATVAGTVVSAIGTISAGKAQAEQSMAQGRARKQAADYEAAQLDMKGKEEHAAAQQDAEEYRRNKQLALSKLQSKAAASGFSATDPTSLALADEISRYGTVQEQMAMYGGTSRRAGDEAQATGARFSGQSAYHVAGLEAKAARKEAMFDAAGTIIGGISGMASKYGQKTAPTTTSYRYG